MLSAEGADMNIEYLKYFLDVAETQSISQAARRNFISPQGMSRAMNELEKDLGCKLLDRFSNRLMLSRSGVDLIPFANKVVSGYEELEGRAVELARKANTAEGTVAIHLLCQRLAGLSFLPPSVMKKMLSRDSSVVFREIDSRETLNIMRTALPDNGKEGLAEIGLVTVFDSQNEHNMADIRKLVDIGYEYRPYLTTYDMALVSRDSPLAQKASLSRQDILSYPLASTDTILYDLLAERFGEDSIALTSGEFAFRRMLVEEDLAITFLPAIAQLHIDPNGKSILKPFDDSYDVQVGFIGLKENLDSPLFKTLIIELNKFYRPHLDKGFFELEQSAVHV